MGTLSVDKLVKTSAGAAEFTLPATDGTAGQVMQTDGAGQLSVAALAADTVTATQIAANAVGNSEMADDAVGLAELSATGTASASVFLRGDNSWAAAGTDVSGLASVQVFTTLGSQTWTRPTGITKVIVEVQGAGGSGGRGYSNGAGMGGGGGGGYAKKFLDVSSIGTSTVVIGAGGASQTTDNTNGSAGGDSSWSDGTNTITGNGGAGGYGNTAYGRVAGGTGVGGDFNIQGGSGTSGGASNRGGDSFYGTGTNNTWIGQMLTDPPSGYGAASGGAFQISSDAGTQGIVIVTEYK